MSMSVNKVILIGHVGQSPEVGGEGSRRRATFSIATNEVWKDKDGEKQERVDWHNITVFGPLVDVVDEYVGTGRQLYIEGQLRHNKVEGEDGETRYFTNVVVSGPGSKLVLLGGGRHADSDDDDDRPSRGRERGRKDKDQGRERPRRERDEPADKPDWQAADDDVPF